MFFCIFFAGDGECLTKSGPQSQKKCIFPFKYKGKTYNECVWFRNEDDPWCSTNVTETGHHIQGKKQYGYCGHNCPIPQKPKGKPRFVFFQPL